MAIRTALFKKSNDKATYPTLIILVTGQRGQSIHLLNLDGMSMSSQSCSFELLDHIKTSKPIKRDSSIDIGSYTPDNTLCPLLTLKEYFKKTEPLRGTEKKLFIEGLNGGSTCRLPVKIS